MKKAIVAGVLGLTALSAQAFTINKVESVKIYEFNEILNRNIGQPVNLWVGIDDDGKEYVQLDIDTGLKTFKIEMPDYKNNETFLEWKYMLDKTVEWAKVAKENKVDVSKDFRGEKNILNCTDSQFYCGGSFGAHSDGKYSNMSVFMQDKSNEFYKIHGTVLLEDVMKLKTAVDNIDKKIAERKASLKDKPQGTKKEALFK